MKVMKEAQVLDVAIGLKKDTVRNPVLVIDSDEGFLKHVRSLRVVAIEGAKLEERYGKAEDVGKKRD
jgi:hypothetical protein